MSLKMTHVMCKLQLKLDMCLGPGRLYFLTSKCQVARHFAKPKGYKYNITLAMLKRLYTTLKKASKHTRNLSQEIDSNTKQQSQAAWELYNIARKQPCKWMGQLLSHGKWTTAGLQAIVLIVHVTLCNSGQMLLARCCWAHARKHFSIHCNAVSACLQQSHQFMKM